MKGWSRSGPKGETGRQLPAGARHGRGGEVGSACAGGGAAAARRAGCSSRGA